MKKKLRDLLIKQRNKLLDINQKAGKENDDDTKKWSCYLVECYDHVLRE